MTHETTDYHFPRWMASLLALTLGGLLLSSCGTAPTSGRSVEGAIAIATETAHHAPEKPGRYLGKFVYQQHCGGCHGSVGPALDVPGKRLSEERVTELNAATAERLEARKVEDDIFGKPDYPPVVGPYDDLFDFKWFANGGEFSKYETEETVISPLGERSYYDLFHMLTEEPHGGGTEPINFKERLSDRERWAVVYYISNMALDNGKADWQYVWDQQITLRNKVYGTHCSICHGAVGRGDGPEGHMLVPKPMNFNYIDWASGTKPGYPVTDEYLYEIIANGKIHPGTVVAAGEGDEPRWTGMPWWKDQFREEDMWALVDFIRSTGYVSD